MSTPYKPELTHTAIHKLVFLVPEVANCELGLWEGICPTIYTGKEVYTTISDIFPVEAKGITVDTLKIDLSGGTTNFNFPGYTVQQYLDGVMKVYGR